jgi:hypothetical protein
MLTDLPIMRLFYAFRAKNAPKQREIILRREVIFAFTISSTLNM